MGMHYMRQKYSTFGKMWQKLVRHPGGRLVSGVVQGLGKIIQLWVQRRGSVWVTKRFSVLAKGEPRETGNDRLDEVGLYPTAELWSMLWGSPSQISEQWSLEYRAHPPAPGWGMPFLYERETEEQIRASKWTGDIGIWGRLADKDPCYENKGKKSKQVAVARGLENEIRDGLLERRTRCYELQNGDWSQLSKLCHETKFWGKWGLGMSLQEWNIALAPAVGWAKDKVWNHAGTYIVSIWKSGFLLLLESTCHKGSSVPER